MLDSPLTKSLRGQYINGQWVRPARTFADLNPSTGQLFAEAPDGTRADAAAAIEAAQAAFPAWAAMKFTERAHLMNRISDIWERRAPDFIAGVQAEGGGWFGKGAFEAHYVTEVFRSAAAICYQPLGEVLLSEYGKFSTAVRSPMGVISVISPWNFPGILTARGFGFALCDINGIGQRRFAVNNPHTASTTSGSSFNNDGIANFFCQRFGIGFFRDRAIAAGYGRDSRFRHGLAC